MARRLLHVNFLPLCAVSLTLLCAGPGPRGSIGGPAAPATHGDDARAEPVVGLDQVRGVTISCQTWGWEWGTPGFGEELDELAQLGVNWVAIHPYASIRADGGVGFREFDPEQPPEWLSVPIAAARERGMGILVKPHLAYWGSPFSWRGEIDFEEPAQLARFFDEYRAWITLLARATKGAHAFAVGTELDKLLVHDARWREVIRDVRAVTPARLTYAANWTDFERVGFWDALDAVGVQGYFPLHQGSGAPLTSSGEIDRATLEDGWASVVARLRRVHERSGKPVVLSELGYDCSPLASCEPWKAMRRAPDDVDGSRALQLACYDVAFRHLERERAWLRGGFLWKWFVGEPGRGDHDFKLDTPPVRAAIRAAWAQD